MSSPITYRGYYHGNMPEWRNAFNKTGSYIGIEYEVQAALGSYREILRLVPPCSKNNVPLAEEDGSLSEYSGVELIFRPFKLDTLKKGNSVFQSTVKAIAPAMSVTRNTGMHLNLNTRGWSERQARLFVGVVHNLPAAWLERIGGRVLNNYCRQRAGWPLPYYESQVSYSHAHAAEWQRTSNRIEIRFPKPLTDPVKLNNLLDFVGYLEAFSKYLEPQDFYPQNTTSWLKAKDMFEVFMRKSKKRKKIMSILKGEAGAG